MVREWKGGRTELWPRERKELGEQTPVTSYCQSLLISTKYVRDFDTRRVTSLGLAHQPPINSPINKTNMSCHEL